MHNIVNTLTRVDTCARVTFHTHQRLRVEIPEALRLPPIPHGMASRWPRKHSVPFLYTMFVGVMLTYSFTDAIIPPITRGGSPRRCCNGGGPPLKDNAVLTEPRILTLRGGGATSGIWETFNRMQADVKHKLDQIKVSSEISSTQTCTKLLFDTFPNPPSLTPHA